MGGEREKRRGRIVAGQKKKQLGKCFGERRKLTSGKSPNLLEEWKGPKRGLAEGGRIMRGKVMAEQKAPQMNSRSATGAKNSEVRSKQKWSKRARKLRRESGLERRDGKGINPNTSKRYEKTIDLIS